MTQKFGFDSLFSRGSVVDIDMHRWSAKVRLTTADLGLPDSPEVDRALTMGFARLIPKRAMDDINEIAAKAKRDVEYHSFSFPFVKGARFTPEHKLDILLAKLKMRAEEIAKTRDDFLFNGGYDAAQKEMRPVIRKALLDASKNEETAEAAFLRVMNEYPTKEELKQKIRLTWTVYAITAPKVSAAQDTIGQEAETVKSLIRTMIEQLRGEVTDKIGSVMAAIAKGGAIRKDTLESVNDVLTRIDEMNIFGDTVLKEQVYAVRQILAQAETTKKGNGSRVSALIGDLVTVQKTIEASVEEAVAEAEKSLTGVGRRKIAVDKKGAA